MRSFGLSKTDKHVNSTTVNNSSEHQITVPCIFIFKGFRTSVFIFIVISRKFRPLCPPAFFRCLSNSGTFTELRTTSFIESTGVAYSDSISHNQVQVLSIPVLLLACSQDWTCYLRMIISLEASKHRKKAGGHIGRNVVEITINMKTINLKPFMIKIIKLRLRNLDN